MSGFYGGGSNTAAFFMFCVMHVRALRLRHSKLDEMMASQFTVHGRLWIEGPDGTVLGHGRVELLEKIDALGSLSAAANALGMSYRYAWKLVKSMNAHSDSPLITLNAGGRGGGHASLTEVGRKAVASYRDTNREFEQFLSEQSDKLPG